MPRKSTDFIILGAGIAGISLAEALACRGGGVMVADHQRVASGASGTPLGLVNLATGRRGTKVWKAEACYEAVQRLLETASPFSEAPFYKRNGVLRPALSHKMARKMKKQYDKTTWREDWCRWEDKQQIEQRHPGIRCVEGGLWLPVGMTVEVPRFLAALQRYLREKLSVRFHEAGYELSQTKSGWELHTGRDEVAAQTLVCATGYGTMAMQLWSDLDLPMEAIKGQVARFRGPASLLDFDHSISSLGYIAKFRDQTFIQGSTYEHSFKDLNPDPDGADYLKKRLRKPLPELAEQAELIDQWAGVRVSTPDRKPIAGRHPAIDNLCLFTALGSKGLLYGSYLARQLADHLTDGNALDKAVSLDRFKDR